MLLFWLVEEADVADGRAMGGAGGAVPAACQGTAVEPAANDERHPVAARERRQVARRPGRTRSVVDGAQTFIRWTRLGVWDRLLKLVESRRVELGMTFLDGTSVRAHQKAAGAFSQRPLTQAERQVRLLAVLVAAAAPRPA